jgi:hypothetical protein
MKYSGSNVKATVGVGRVEVGAKRPRAPRRNGPQNEGGLRSSRATPESLGRCDGLVNLLIREDGLDVVVFLERVVKLD